MLAAAFSGRGSLGTTPYLSVGPNRQHVFDECAGWRLEDGCVSDVQVLQCFTPGSSIANGHDTRTCFNPVDWGRRIA